MTAMHPSGIISWPNEPDVDEDGSIIDPFYFPFAEGGLSDGVWESSGSYVFCPKPLAGSVSSSMIAVPCDLNVGSIGGWAFTVEMYFPTVVGTGARGVSFGLGPRLATGYAPPFGGGSVGVFGSTKYVGIASNNNSSYVNGLWGLDEWNKFTLVCMAGTITAIYINDTFVTSVLYWTADQRPVSGPQDGFTVYAPLYDALEANAIRFRNFKAAIVRLSLP